jgi:hypothetical protein
MSANGHDCRLIGKLGEFIWTCSRCGGCYVCEHVARIHGLKKEWYWLCRDGKLRPVINDGRKKADAVQTYVSNSY